MPRSITERQMEAMRAFAAELRREKATTRDNTAVQRVAQGDKTEDALSPSRELLKAKLAEAAPQVRDLLKSFGGAETSAPVTEENSALECATDVSDNFAEAPVEPETLQPSDEEPLDLTTSDIMEAATDKTEARRITPALIAQNSDDDAAWIAANLRCENGKPYRDIANVVRILMRHPDFAGRFWFNKAMVKVVDRGAIMLDWQVNALAADVQERFLPEISEDVVAKAVVIAANRTDRFAR